MDEETKKKFLEDLLSDTVELYNRAKELDKMELANWYQKNIDVIKKKLKE